ncbi:MAG: GIY-YIG nuclease family protein [Candidatus Shapirobacteria bacterium]|nr:GIY-YIG nuclease family protein [Candidatus Shapirobacteria bacterium]
MDKNQEIKTASFSPKKIPAKSGVYLFLNQTGKAIYIGKAINLRHRLSSYFQGKIDLKTTQIINRADRVSFIITPSEFEALILEAKLIKEHQPKYNVCLKDDKRYLYIKITKEDFPQVGTARKTTSRAILFGPFPSAKTVRFILKQIRQIFPYRSCRQMPPNACLYQDLGLCPAPCVNNDQKNKKDYQQQIKAIKRLLSGQRQSLINQYQKEMSLAAKKTDYETANQVKQIYNGLIFLTQQRIDPGVFLAGLDLKDNHQDRLKSLEKMLSGYFDNLEHLTRIEAYDVANLAGQEATGSLVVFNQGQPDIRQYRQFKIKQASQPNDVKMIAETLSRRLKHPEWPYPKLIVVDGGKPQLSAVLTILKENNLDIPALGLAKKEETVIIKRGSYFRSINLDRQSPALLVLRAIRDEAHRFAQKYHHYLRKKTIQS